MCGVTCETLRQVSYDTFNCHYYICHVFGCAGPKRLRNSWGAVRQTIIKSSYHIFDKTISRVVIYDWRNPDSFQVQEIPLQVHEADFRQAFGVARLPSCFEGHAVSCCDRL